MSYDDLDVLGLEALALMLIVCAVAVFWPKRRNKRRGLPPPSDACRRNGPGAVP